MQHYVYRITNIEEQKHYYGCRSTNLKPTNDLGKRYFSSSSDMSFRRLQKTSPEKFKYKILSVHDNREDALLKEIRLHKRFDVKNNPKFYNQSNQLSLGFSCNNKGRTKQKGSDNSHAKKINIFDSERKLVYSIFGGYEDFCRKHNLPIGTLRSSYYDNGRPIFLKNDRKMWAIRNGYKNYIGWYALYDEIENHSEEHYNELVKIELDTVHQNSKKTIIYNSNREMVYAVEGRFSDFCKTHDLPHSVLDRSKRNNGQPAFQSKYGKSLAKERGLEQFIGWYAIMGDKNHTREEYDSLVSELRKEDDNVQSIKAVRMSEIPLNGKKINIYDAQGNLKFETCGDFEKVCKVHGLPYSLGESHRNNGIPIFTSFLGMAKARKNGQEQFIGWYAKKV